MAPYVLDPHVGFSILSHSHGERDRHEELGCGLQGPASRSLRRALDGLRRRIGRLGRARSIARAEELVKWLDERPEYRALCTSRKRAGRRELKEAVLYPDPARLPPRTVHVRRGLEAFELDLEPEDFPALADALAWIAAGLDAEEIRHHAPPAIAELLAELEGAGWLAEGEPLPGPDPRDVDGGLLYVGHNTVLVASQKTRVLVDPWFRPWHEGDPENYRPLLPHQLGPVDAILITHSHGDHFHLGSLLHFPRDTPVIVPPVERETVLSTDLALRLAQLGFTDVRRPAAGETVKLGDVRVEVLPFRGEQPTVSELVYPEIRNIGSTYVVRTPLLSAAFLADSGRDGTGTMVDAALAVRRRTGPVDFVFTGIRSFRIHPVLYPFTTLDTFLLNVPLELSGVSQQLMNGVEDGLDLAEAFGAKFLVPYADGGAPWYWREGMGPAYRGYPEYPGFRQAALDPAEEFASDPFPERARAAAAARYGGEGPVRALVLRPGDAIRRVREGLAVRRFPGHAWPYGDEPAGLDVGAR
jgi:L-ascorbate metabolism protein UlaG (beta-lactamase superfamily)